MLASRVASVAGLQVDMSSGSSQEGGGDRTPPSATDAATAAVVDSPRDSTPGEWSIAIIGGRVITTGASIIVGGGSRVAAPGGDLVGGARRTKG